MVINVKTKSDSCNSLTTVRPCECEIRIVLFFVLRRAFSRPFVIDLLLCQLAGAGGETAL